MKVLLCLVLWVSGCVVHCGGRSAVDLPSVDKCLTFCAPERVAYWSAETWESHGSCLCTAGVKP